MAKKFYIRECVDGEDGGYNHDILELTEEEAATIKKLFEGIPSWIEPTVRLLPESFETHDDAVVYIWRL